MNYDEIADDVQLESPAPAAPAANTDRAAIAIRDDIGRMETALTEFDRVSAGLAELRERFPVDVVYDVTTTKGMADAIAHRAAWRDPRINVEKLRKMAKAPVLALGKNIDARAAWLTERLLEGEKPIDDLIKAEEARKERIKQERAEREAGRILAIQEAIAEFSMIAMSVASKPSAAIAAEIEKMRAAEPDPVVFQEMIEQAKAAKQSALIKMDMALKAKQHDEAEAAKREAERAELEQLRRQAAEQKAKDEAAAAEARRLEAEKAAAERAAAAAEQRRLDAEAAARRAEEDRIAAEARAKAQAEHEEAMRKEREAAAEAKRQADAKAAKEAEKRRKAEAAAQKVRDAAPAMLDVLQAALQSVDRALLVDTFGAEWVKQAEAAVAAAI